MQQALDNVFDLHPCARLEALLKPSAKIADREPWDRDEEGRGLMSDAKGVDDVHPLRQFDARRDARPWAWEMGPAPLPFLSQDSSFC